MTARTASKNSLTSSVVVVPEKGPFSGTTIHRFLRRVLSKKKTLYHCSQEKLDRLTQCIRDYPRRIFNGLSARENHNEKIRESVSK